MRSILRSKTSLVLLCTLAAIGGAVGLAWTVSARQLTAREDQSSAATIVDPDEIDIVKYTGPSNVPQLFTPGGKAEADEEASDADAPPNAVDAETVDRESVEPAPSESEKAERFTFRYRFEKGRGLHYEVVQRSHIETSKAELRDTTDSATEIAKHLRVISVDDAGVALIETTIDAARMAVQFDDTEPITFDSRDGDDPPKQFRDLAARVGRPLARMKVSPRGELLSLTKLDGTRPNDKSQNAEAKGGEELGVTDNVLVEFPERALAVGDSWRQDFEVDVLVTKSLTRKAKLQRTFRLASVEDGLATIEFEIAILSIVRDPQISIQLLQRTPKGRITFDLNAGRIVSRTQTSHEQIFGPFGPGSEMLATAQRSERLRDPDAAKADD